MTANPSQVLVTGADGYVGAEVALEFFRAGFSTRLTVQVPENATLWRKKYPEYRSGVDFVVVPDLETPGAYDEGVRGVKYIAHTASPVNFSPKVWVLPFRP